MERGALFLALGLLALLATAVGWLAVVGRREHRRFRDEEALRDLITMFAPGLSAVRQDPRALLVWFPLAETARRLMPDMFARIDHARGSRFPFTPDDIQAAHARWTTEWLAWERSHDADYKLKVAALEDEAARRGDADLPITRSRLERVEREKLDTYQVRYEEYVRVAKAIAALGPDAKRGI